MEPKGYGLFVKTRREYSAAVEAVKTALKAEGFGVLTEIDVADTMKQKLGQEFRRYDIIGACNPPLAHRALEADIDIGLLLPCNVIVYEDEAGGSVIAALDPETMMRLTKDDRLTPVAAEARSRLVRALRSVEG
jgi:uncharacterized protein (DUF302 family)